MGKVKDHLARHRVVYISGAALTLGMGAGYILASKTGVSIRPVQVLTWKSKQTIEVFIEALGDPGNIIQDTTTGTIYASQGQAARELGINPARLSEHLKGKTDNVLGHVFTKLGKAGASV